MHALHLNICISLNFDSYYGRLRAKAKDFARVAWQKSSFSDYNGSCFEVARLMDDRVGVRDTKDNGADLS